MLSLAHGHAVSRCTAVMSWNSQTVPNSIPSLTRGHYRHVGVVAVFQAERFGRTCIWASFGGNCVKTFLNVLFKCFSHRFAKIKLSKNWLKNQKGICLVKLHHLLKTHCDFIPLCFGRLMLRIVSLHAVLNKETSLQASLINL